MKNLIYFILGCLVTGFLWWDVERNPKDSISQLMSEQKHSFNIRVGYDPEQELHGHECGMKSMGCEP